MARILAPLVIVMGVSGCGKSSLGPQLARRLSAEFLEGDHLHPPRNAERISAGIALTEVDRRDWFLAIAEQLADARAAQHAMVVSCPALRYAYRDMLRAAASQLAFVHLDASRDLLEARLRAGPGHPMPDSLLESQLQALELPRASERALSLDASLPLAQLADQAAAWVTRTGLAPERK